jgi:hypothetical protein
MVASSGESRKAVLRAALGFLQLHHPLWRWLDSWAGIGHITVGMMRHGYDVSLTSYPEGWRATFLHRDHWTRPWVGQILRFHPTPWRAVQHAAWEVLTP